MQKTLKTRFSEHEKRTLALINTQRKPEFRKRVLEFYIDQAIKEITKLDTKRDRIFDKLQAWNRELDTIHAEKVGGVG